jgi:hypothetical protein
VMALDLLAGAQFLHHQPARLAGAGQASRAADGLHVGMARGGGAAGAISHHRRLSPSPMISS